MRKLEQCVKLEGLLVLLHQRALPDFGVNAVSSWNERHDDYWDRGIKLSLQPVYASISAGAKRYEEATTLAMVVESRSLAISVGPGSFFARAAGSDLRNASAGPAGRPDVSGRETDER